MDKGYPEPRRRACRRQPLGPSGDLEYTRARMAHASADIEIRDSADDEDRRRFADINAESFAGNAAHNMRWLQAAVPHAPLRLVTIGGEIVGGYMLLPCGQFFGGRSVPAQAVTAVAVHPAYRRRGVAGALM